MIYYIKCGHGLCLFLFPGLFCLPFLKNGVFITTKFDAMRIRIQHCEMPWPRKSPFWPLLVCGRVSERCNMFVWIVVLMVTYVSE